MTTPRSNSSDRKPIPATRLTRRGRNAASAAGVPIEDPEQRLTARLDQFAAALSDRDREALAQLLGGGATPLTVLAAQPADAVLAPDELAIHHRLAAEPAPAAPMRDTVVLVMKATRLCNLRCSYCHFWREGGDQTMTFEVMARAVRDVLRSPGVRVVEFVWHGGETLLVPWEFYRKALWLQEHWRRPGQTVKNAIQTNGTLLDDAWIARLRDYRFSAGVSLDGPPEIHDARRRSAGGRPTAQAARDALARLRAAGVDSGINMVIDDDVMALGAERILQYFLAIGVEDVGLLNVLPGNRETAPTRWYAHWDRYVEFLRELFRAWWPDHVERIRLRELYDLVGKVAGGPSQTCLFTGDCMGGFLTVEPSGAVMACDKYIDDPAYVFGNLLDEPLPDLLRTGPLTARRAELAAEAEPARACRWYSVCRAACPHDRYLRGRLGVPDDASCCGLAPLLADIDAAWRGAAPPQPDPEPLLTTRRARRQGG